MKLAALVFLTVPTLSAGTLVFLTSPQAAELKLHPDARTDFRATPRIPAKSRHGLHCSCCDLDAFATLCRRRFSKAVHDKMKPPSDVGRVP